MYYLIFDLSNDADDTVSNSECPICNEYTLKVIPVHDKSSLQRSS